MSNRGITTVIDATGASHGVVLAPGEMVADLTTGQHRIGDGVTPGGKAQVTAVPVNPRSLLRLSNTMALNATFTNWIGASGANIINYANGGGIYFGTTQFDLTLGTPKPSMWMRGTLHHAIYFAWRLATDAINAGDTSQTAAQAQWAAVIEATWADSKANYSETNFRYSQQTGYQPLCVTMDDVGIVGLYLRDVVNYYGATTTEGARALSYLVSLLINALVRFRDPRQTGADLFDYGITDPVTGTAFKSTRYGVMYADTQAGSAQQAGGYSSSGFEACWGYLAAWLASQTTLTAGLRTAFAAYAGNTYTLLQLFKTPAPTDASRPSAGQIFASFNLDPNIHTVNTDPTSNGGQPFRGAVDTNQTYHQPADAYFGKGVRALTSIWDVCTIWYGCMCGQLYKNTGTATYLTEAINAGNTMVDVQGCGRMLDGLLHIGNLRDPHSAGGAWAIYMRLMYGQPGFDTSYALRGALIRTARRIAQTGEKGFLGPDWAGTEWSQNEQTWTWGETSAHQGNGGSGQAKATQQMTHGCGLVMLAAAMVCANDETTIDTLGPTQSVVEQLGAQVSALKSAVDQIVLRLSPTINGQLTIQDLNYFLRYEAGGPVINWNGPTSGRTFDSYNVGVANREFWVQGVKVGHFDAGGFTVNGSTAATNAAYFATNNFSLMFYAGADSNGYPLLQFANGNFDRYVPSTVNREFWVQGGRKFHLDTGGATVHGALGIEQGTFFNTTAMGLNFFAGQDNRGYPTLQLANGAALIFNQGNNRFELKIGGNLVADLDASGNMRLKGTLAQSQVM